MHDRQACALCRLSKIAAAIAWCRVCQCARASTRSRANRLPFCRNLLSCISLDSPFQSFAKIGIDRFRAFRPNPSTIFSRLESFGLASRTHTIRACHVQRYMANIPRPRPSWPRPRCASTGGHWWPSWCRWCASVASFVAFFVPWPPQSRCASYFEGHGLGRWRAWCKVFPPPRPSLVAVSVVARCGTGGGVGVPPRPVPRPLYGVTVSTVSVLLSSSSTSASGGLPRWRCASSVVWRSWPRCVAVFRGLGVMVSTGGGGHGVGVAWCAAPRPVPRPSPSPVPPRWRCASVVAVMVSVCVGVPPPCFAHSFHGGRGVLTT